MSAMAPLSQKMPPPRELARLPTMRHSLTSMGTPASLKWKIAPPLLALLAMSSQPVTEMAPLFK